MSDESSDEEEVGVGGRGMGGGPADQIAAATDDQEEIEYDPDALSVTLVLTGSTVSLDIEIQVCIMTNKRRLSLVSRYRFESIFYQVKLLNQSTKKNVTNVIYQEHQVVLRRVRTAIVVNVQDIIGKPMTPFELIKVLRRRGLEISPSLRVSQMVEELAKNKNGNLERHLYRCLAFLIATEKFSFLHSRWNVMAGDDNFIIQYQLLDKENPVRNPSYWSAFQLL